MDHSIPDLRYPIGKYEPQPYSDKLKEAWLNDIKFLPQLLENTILNLDESQLQTPYREGGWTVQQVVHHVADSHVNSYVRFKLALTEDNPTIKPYDEAAWAKLADSQLPIEPSLDLIASLHARWVGLLEGMSEADFAKTFNHPERGKQNLGTTLGLYAWHSRHHTAHITSLRARQGW